MEMEKMNQKEWTIMIYMAGDNNLSVDMAYALEQIKGVAGEGAGSPNLFVYYDGNSPSIPTLYCDFSEPNDPKYVRSFMVPDKLYDVPDKQNENAASKKSVLNFIDWCVNKVEVKKNGEVTYGRRAQRYALIFSGHSLGFQDIGLFKDESSGKSMKMTDLYFALQRIVDTQADLERDVRGSGLRGEERDRDTTPLLGQKIDILGFDSCVMGMLEVGYQFGFVAKTMIASEGSVPNAGWTYAKLLGCLTRGDAESSDSNQVAARFVRDFIKSQDSFTVGGSSVDMAAWDLSRLSDLASAFDVLSTVLIECFADPQSKIYRQMERMILQVHWKCQSYMYDQNVDLGDFCELLDRECELVLKDHADSEDLDLLHDVQAECREIAKELKKAVILSGFSGGGYQYSNGISVFFPWSREGYHVSSENYKSLWFAKDATSRTFSWNGFLKKYLNEVTLRKSEPMTESALAGEKYRYRSGIRFNETPATQTLAASASSESKIAGQEGSKIAGEQGSKIAGEQGSKIAGEQGSKIAGEQGSKIAGEPGSKLAGGGSNAFFENLRLFKNIESPWDISGFSKRPADESQGSEKASAGIVD